MSNKPPKIVIPGLNRGAGIPPGFVLGRLPGTGQGPAQLLPTAQLQKLGIATTVATTGAISQSISVVQSEIVSLSTAVSSSISTDASKITSLSTAVSAVDRSQSTSLSQISSSLSGAISSASSLSTAISSVDGNQSTSLSQISSSLSGAISSTSSLSTAVSSVDRSQSTSLSQISSVLSVAGLPAIIILPNYTVATLPTPVLGATAFITDGSTTLTLGLGLTAVGGGTNKVPVYSDGTNWIVG